LWLQYQGDNMRANHLRQQSHLYDYYNFKIDNL
jgi:hypothetical protein